MKEIKTDWFPIDTPPVNPGKYDVVLRLDLLTEVESQAVWDFKYGQWQFWSVEATPGHSVTKVLPVVRWRGRELPRRTQLEPTRSRVALLPQSEG